MTDRAAVIKLAEQHMLITRQFYQQHGYERGNVETVLTAQAYAIATTIVGTKGEAWPFFDQALQRAIDDMQSIRETGRGKDAADAGSKRALPKLKRRKKLLRAVRPSHSAKP